MSEQHMSMGEWNKLKRECLEAVETRLDAIKPADDSELFHGYTMEQWQRIIDECHPDGTKKYLCYMSVGEGEDSIRTLLSLVRVDEHDSWPFVSNGLGSWESCRPAQRYGALTPHFGGGKPEWLQDDDLIVWRREGDKAGGLNSFATYIACGVEWNKVDEFIAMPGDA